MLTQIYYSDIYGVFRNWVDAGMFKFHGSRSNISLDDLDGIIFKIFEVEFDEEQFSDISRLSDNISRFNEACPAEKISWLLAENAFFLLKVKLARRGFVWDSKHEFSNSSKIKGQDENQTSGLEGERTDRFPQEAV
jgi:hypothetical protein